MAQKAFPNSLRPSFTAYEGSSVWNEPNFNYIKHNIKTLIKASCVGTTLKLDKILVKQYHDNIFIEAFFVQFCAYGLKRYVSRRFKENKKTIELNSWQKLAQKLNLCAKFICSLLNIKKVQIKARRLKTFSKHIPLEARRKMGFYKRLFNTPKYPYARSGLQLMNLIVKGKISANTLAYFLYENIKTKKKRKRHHQFLRFLEQGLRALEPKREVNLKIQIKGRFGRRAKGRSQTWKYHMGFIPLGQLGYSVDTAFLETRTAYGSVGFKVLICKRANQF